MYSWSIRFRETIYDNNQLRLLSEEYFEDLLDEHVTHNQFVMAAKMVRKRCSYFPKMSDIMDALYEYRSRPRSSDSLQLPAETKLSPAEEEFGKIQIEICRQAAQGVITWVEATAQLERLTAGRMEGNTNDTEVNEDG